MSTPEEKLQQARDLIDSALADLAQTLPPVDPDPAEPEPEVPVGLVIDEGIIQAFDPVQVQGISEVVVPFAFDCSARDFILYGKAQLSGLAGEAAVISLENAGRSRQIQVAVGYNFGTSSAQAGRVSIKTKASGGDFTHAGAGGVASVSEFAEFAAHLDCDRGALNLWIRDGDVWRWAGSCPAPRFAISQVRFLTRNGSTAPSGQSVAFEDVVVCRVIPSMGDSIGAGHNAFDPVPSYYSGTDNGLSQWQAHCWPFQGLRNSIIVNKGIGGQNSAQLKNRVSELTKHGSPIVFLHCSTNDYGAGFSMEQRTANIQTSIDACVSAGCQVVLLGSIYPNNQPSAAYYKQWRDEQLQNVTGYLKYVEIMDAVADPATRNMDHAYETDGVHPNVAGYALIGQSIAAEVSAVLG